MENRDQPTNTVAVLSDAELLNLLSIAGVRVGPTSPFARLISGASPAQSQDVSRLQQFGLLASANPARPTAECLKALTILASPDAETRLLWGNPERVNFSAVFSTRDAGSRTLVVYTRDEGGNNRLSYFLSHDDVIDLIKGGIAFSEVKEAPDFSLKTNAATLPVFFGVLDLYQEARLRAALDRRREFQPDLSPEEVKRILVDAKMEASLSWYAPVGYMIVPDKTGIDDASIKEGLGALKRAGVIATTGGLTALSSGLSAFAHRAFPVVSYCGVKVSVNQGTSIAAMELGLIRGVAALLLIQLDGDKNGGSFLLNSITTSDIPELIFNITGLPFEAPAAAQKASAPMAPTQAEMLTCAKCGTRNTAGDKFCTKCGAQLDGAVMTRFCPNCGDAVAAGEKFCDKCGTKLS